MKYAPDPSSTPKGYEPFWRQYEWLSQMIAWEFNPEYWSLKMKAYSILRMWRGTFFVKCKKPRYKTRHYKHCKWKATMSERPLVGYEGSEPQNIDSIIEPCSIYVAVPISR